MKRYSSLLEMFRRYGIGVSTHHRHTFYLFDTPQIVESYLLLRCYSTETAIWALDGTKQRSNDQPSSPLQIRMNLPLNWTTKQTNFCTKKSCTNASTIPDKLLKRYFTERCKSTQRGRHSTRQLQQKHDSYLHFNDKKRSLSASNGLFY